MIYCFLHAQEACSVADGVAERWFAAHLYTIFIDTPLIPYIGTADTYIHVADMAV